MIEIKILDSRAKIPESAYKSDAGFDLKVILDNIITIEPNQTVMLNTGIAISMAGRGDEIMAIIVPRSGKGAKEGKVLGNLTGIIDKTYEGEIKISLWNRTNEPITIEPYEKVAQLIFMPIIKPYFVEVKEFSSRTERGSNGFGSTG